MGTSSSQVINGLGSVIFSGVVDKIKESYYEFGKQQIQEIAAIQKAYTDYCLPHEREASPSTLTIGRIGDNVANNILPIFFETENAKNTIPIVFRRQFAPNKNGEDWKKQLNKQTSLANIIEEMLSYICNYQNERDKRFAKKGYNYDPTNLFFEELKAWLIELSKVQKPYTIKTIGIIEGRAQYLTEFINKKIFNQNEPEPTRLTTICTMLEKLEIILNRINLELNGISAREDFQSIYFNIKQIISDSLKFIFYIFRDTPNTPVDFIVTEIFHPKLLAYVESAKTITTELLSYLISTPSIAFLFLEENKIKKLEADESNKKIIALDKICCNNFIAANGKLIFPLTNAKITLYSWLDAEALKLAKKELGVFPEFRNKKTMNDFLKFHGLVQKMGHFAFIAKLLLDLANDGGNVLVYGKERMEVQAVLNEFEKLIVELQEVIKELFNVASDYKRKVIKQKDIVKKVDGKSLNNWETNYDLADQSQRSITKNITICRQGINKIRLSMHTVNEKEYSQTVKNRLEILSFLVEKFVGQNNVANGEIDSPIKLTSRLSTNRSAFLPNLAAKMNETAITDSKPAQFSEEANKEIILLLNNYNKDFGLGKYQYILDDSATQLKKLENASNQKRCGLFIIRARCYVRLQNLFNAKFTLDRALEVDIKNTDALYYRASVYLELNLAKEALADVSELKNLEPKDEKVNILFNRVINRINEKTVFAQGGVKPPSKLSKDNSNDTNTLDVFHPELL